MNDKENIEPLVSDAGIQAWIDDDNPRNVDQSAKAQDIRRATAHRAFDHANKVFAALSTQQPTPNDEQQGRP